MNEIQYQKSAVDPGTCIGTAWELVTKKFWLYVGVAFVAMLLIGCVPFVAWFIFGPIMAGFYYIGLRDLRGEPVDFGMLFKGFEKFVPLMVVGLIQQIPGIILTVVQYTVDASRFFGGGGTSDVNFYQSSGDIFPSEILAGITAMFAIVIFVMIIVAIVWTLALSFAIPLVLEHDLSVGDALVTSVKAAFGNIGRMILLALLGGLVALLGLLVLCVGLFVAIPVIYLGNVIAYRQVFPYVGPSNINTGPPPPDYYGGSAGQGQQFRDPVP
jgi:hypothetical protein